MNPSRKLTVAHYRCSECELRFFTKPERNEHEKKIHRPNHTNEELTYNLLIEKVTTKDGQSVVYVSQR